MKTFVSMIAILVAATGLAACGPSTDTKGKDKKAAVSKDAAKSPEAKAEVSTGDSAAGPGGQPEDLKKVHRVVGVVKAIDMAEGEVTLDHEPVASLYWPATTRKFGVRGTVAGQLKTGQQVEFEFVVKNGDYVVTALK